MKITAPHLGNVYLSAKALFDGLGIEYIMPPFCNSKALEIGSLNSPEEMCLPYKIMVGNYMQAIEKGANTVILPGSCGPCRFGEYCELQMNLMKRLGHDLEFIVLDFPQDIGIKELTNRVKRISDKSNKSKRQKIKALLDAIKVVNLIDYIEEKAYYLGGYEKKRGTCKSILESCKKQALDSKNPQEMISILKKYKKDIDKVEVDRSKDPIKISIIGEIYTVIEPFSNLYLQDKLMDYGVSTRRGLTLSWWVKNGVLSPTGLNSIDIKKGAKEYLNLGIGGHARECIGEAVLADEEGFDGAIQIFPMGCMPEIVSKAILPSISKDKDFPKLGYNHSDIINGLCQALVRNYLNNVGKGKEILTKAFFQGGVAANKGIKASFEKALGFEVTVPENFNVMGSAGAAILARDKVEKTNKTNFKGFNLVDNIFETKSFECSGCSNNCEVVQIKENKTTIGCFGDRCGKWTEKISYQRKNLIS